MVVGCVLPIPYFHNTSSALLIYLFMHYYLFFSFSLRRTVFSTHIFGVLYHYNNISSNSNNNNATVNLKRLQKAVKRKIFRSPLTLVNFISTHTRNIFTACFQPKSERYRERGIGRTQNGNGSGNGQRRKKNNNKTITTTQICV